jgi:hypothetical protein
MGNECAIHESSPGKVIAAHEWRTVPRRLPAQCERAATHRHVLLSIHYAMRLCALLRQDRHQSFESRALKRRSYLAEDVAGKRAVAPAGFPVA